MSGVITSTTIKVENGKSEACWSQMFPGGRPGLGTGDSPEWPIALC